MTHEPFSTFSLAKNLAYIPAFLLGLSSESYVILACFMALDTFLGVMRVYVVHGGKYIRSYKLTAGIVSKLSVLLVPLLIAYTGKGVGLDMLWLAQWALGALLLAQFYSIVSNIYSIRLQKDVDEFDAVSWVLRRVQKVIEKALLESSSPTVIPKEELKLKDEDNK